MESQKSFENEMVELDSNGSSISIHNPQAIIDYAKNRKAIVYDVSDFPSSSGISRIQIQAQTLENFGEQQLTVESNIELSNYVSDWDRQNFSRQFKEFFADNQETLSFDLKETGIDNFFVLLDRENGAELVIWADSNQPLVTIRNKIFFYIPGSKFYISPKPIHTMDNPIADLEFVAKVTANIVNFVQFSHQEAQSDKFANRDTTSFKYVIGKDMRPADKKGLNNSLIGRIAMVQDETLLPTVITSDESVGDQENKTEGTNRSDEVKPAPQEDRPKLNDLVGLDAQRTKLKRIAEVFLNPKTAKEKNIKRHQSILLYGPNGSGKSSLVRALAGEIGANLVNLSSEQIYGQFIGESEQNIATRLEEQIDASHYHPVIICIEEFDSVIICNEDASSAADTIRKSVASIFKKVLRNLPHNAPNLMVVAMTTDRDKVSPSLKAFDIFSSHIPLTLPGVDARREFIGNYVTQNEQNYLHSGIHFDYQNLAIQTEGFSFSKILAVLEHAAEEIAFREENNETTTEGRKLTLEDIESAIQYIKNIDNTS